MKNIINVISDSNIGGAGKMLLSFLKLSDKTAFNHLVLIPENSMLAPELAALGIKYQAIKGIGEKSLDMASVQAFVRIFKQFQPAVVHTHASMSARIAARLYGKCKIVHTRHSVFDQSPVKKAFPMKQFGGLINSNLSDIILAVSPAAKENIVETGTDPKKIRVIFNGVDTVPILPEEEKKKIRAQYGFSESSFICAIIARLEEVKGHDYILQAAALLKEYPEIKILIAGGGKLENELRQKAAELPNCVFTGFVKEIYKIENIMDIQLNASYGTEATSLSLLEGMSLSVPAVVSDFGGNPYVIRDGKNGLVTPKKDAQALADAILKLYRDKALYDKLSAGAAKIFSEKFTSKAMTANIEAVYNELLNERR